jgi:HAD superfamily hydrolase (TIGR01544 family)
MATIIQDKKEFNRKIKAIKLDGKENLHILSDFDRTLTYAHFKGEKIPSLLAHLRNGNYLTKDYAEKAHALFNKYHPIEISESIGKEEKSKQMLEWWSSHYNLLAESGLDEKTIKQSTKDLIKEGKIRLREGAREFFESLNKNSLPLIILSSAGIGNMVTEFLKEQKLDFPNIHFIGNTLEFDKSGKFKGIKDNKIIHVLNKHEAEIKNLPVYKELLKRKNLLLLGDSLDDLGMSGGFPSKNVVKIAFVNYEDEKKNLDKYKRSFDIIITEDGDFSEVNKIISELI